MTLRDVIERARAAGFNVVRDFDILAGEDIVWVSNGEATVTWSYCGGRTELYGEGREETAARLDIIDTIEGEDGGCDE